MSTDAFAAAIAKGASLHKPRITEALRMGLIFGTIEAITPVIGWCIGQAASQYVGMWDHWIAFTVLVLLGLHVIYNGLKSEAEFDGELEPRLEKKTQHALPVLMLTAFATSIDALAVGTSLAFVDVNILVAALAIGSATFIMVTIGVMLGRSLSDRIGDRAEIIGGIILILIGCSILYERLAT